MRGYLLIIGVRLYVYGKTTVFLKANSTCNDYDIMSQIVAAFIFKALFNRFLYFNFVQ